MNLGAVLGILLLFSGIIFSVTVFNITGAVVLTSGNTAGYIQCLSIVAIVLGLALLKEEF